VGDRLVGLDGLASLHDQGTPVAGADAKASAGRTGELGGQVLSLLVEEGVEGALGQSVGSGPGDGFQGGEVEGGYGPALGGDTAGDDFAPLPGQNTKILKVLRG